MRNKWHLVEDKTPDNDRHVLVWVNNTKTPGWSEYRIASYHGNWYCVGGRKSYEIVERWTEIPEYDK